MRRWHIRRDKLTGHAYLHHVLLDDEDRALHDHPWDSTSIILRGKMREVLPEGQSRILTPGSITSRKAEGLHRLEIVEGPVWSLFLTGPKYREWGFATENGWVHWEVFTGLRAPVDGEIAAP